MRGIEEWLRRWLWELPPDCEPVKVGYCPTCGENILLVHKPEGPASLNRAGDRHTQHPRGHSPQSELLTDTDILKVEAQVRQSGVRFDPTKRDRRTR